MSRKSLEDIWGLEFDWLAADADGAVGFFSTAGGGYAPEEALEDTQAVRRAIDEILRLPVSTRAVLSRTLAPGVNDPWLMMGERGVFAFDSSLNGAPYQRIATPEVRILVTELPREIAELVQGVRFPQLRFSELNEISAALLMDTVRR